MARLSIGPTHAPTACTTRNVMTISIEPESAQPTEPTRKSSAPSASGTRRPTRSLIGPQISWAMAKPTRKLVIVSAAEPPRSSCRSGIAGR